MFFEKAARGFALRVRLAPNSSCCKTGGVFIDAAGAEWLKAYVRAAPEDGKANRELIEFLAKRLKTAKTKISIASGEFDRYKRLVVEVGDACELERLNGGG